MKIILLASVLLCETIMASYTPHTVLSIDNTEQEETYSLFIQKPEVGYAWEKCYDIPSKQKIDIDITNKWFVPAHCSYIWLDVCVKKPEKISSHLRMYMYKNNLKYSLNHEAVGIQGEEAIIPLNHDFLKFYIALALKGKDLSESTCEIKLLAE